MVVQMLTQMDPRGNCAKTVWIGLSKNYILLYKFINLILPVITHYLTINLTKYVTVTSMPASFYSSPQIIKKCAEKKKGLSKVVICV